MAGYAVIAGRGNLPKLVIAELDNPKVICFEGERDESIHADLVTRFGRVGEIIEFLKSHEIKKVVFAGAMARPDLKKISPDAEGAKLLAKLMASSIFGKSMGDDKLLTTITQYLEGKGFEVVGVSEVISALKAPAKVLTESKPDALQKEDIRIGMEVLERMGELDIGQAVVVEDGVVLAVEAVEGTERMIERAGLLKKSYGGVLVKSVKPGQSRKVDLPSVGADTVKQVIAAGITGIAISAGTTLLIGRDEMVARANEAGVFIAGVEK